MNFNTWIEQPIETNLGSKISMFTRSNAPLTFKNAARTSFLSLKASSTFNVRFTVLSLQVLPLRKPDWLSGNKPLSLAHHYSLFFNRVSKSLHKHGVRAMGLTFLPSDLFMNIAKNFFQL